MQDTQMPSRRYSLRNVTFHPEEDATRRRCSPNPRRAIGTGGGRGGGLELRDYARE